MTRRAFRLLPFRILALALALTASTILPAAGAQAGFKQVRAPAAVSVAPAPSPETLLRAAQAAPTAVPVKIQAAPAVLGSALMLAPECDREWLVSLQGIGYAVAMLHHHWRLAVAAYAVIGSREPYRLWIAFNREGSLCDWLAQPPTQLPEGLAQACLGLGAHTLAPGQVPPDDPRVVLSAAAAAFSKSLADGSWDRAIRRCLDQADSLLETVP